MVRPRITDNIGFKTGDIEVITRLVTCYISQGREALYAVNTTYEKIRRMKLF